MKILMTIPYFVPAWGYGGPVQVCFLLSKKLVQLGHQVTVLTTDALDEEHRVEKRGENIAGIEVVRFPNVSNWMAKKLNAFTPRNMGAWVEEHLRQFDVVHCHDFFVPFNVQINRWAMQYEIPFFVQPHGSAVPKPERGRTLVKKMFNSFWGKSILHRARAVIAVSDAEARDLREYFPGIRVAVLPNGVEIPRVKPVSSWPYGRYGLAPGAPVIISVGRLHPVKGFDLLLDSFIRLHRMVPEACLCIVGPDEGSLTGLQARVTAAGIQKQVVFTGLVVGEEKEQLLASASLFALFSRDDPFTMATLEAAACGLPVVVSCRIGLASQIKESGAGEVVDPFKSRDAAQMMQEMLHPIRAEGYKKNLDRLLEQYDLDHVARSAVELYSGALAHY